MSRTSSVRAQAGGPEEWRQAIRALRRGGPCHVGDHDYVRFLVGGVVRDIRCANCGRRPIDELGEMVVRPE